MASVIVLLSHWLPAPACDNLQLVHFQSAPTFALPQDSGTGDVQTKHSAAHCRKQRGLRNGRAKLLVSRFVQNHAFLVAAWQEPRPPNCPHTLKQSVPPSRNQTGLDSFGHAADNGLLTSEHGRQALFWIRTLPMKHILTLCLIGASVVSPTTFAQTTKSGAATSNDAKAAAPDNPGVDTEEAKPEYVRIRRNERRSAVALETSIIQIGRAHV